MIITMSRYMYALEHKAYIPFIIFLYERNMSSCLDLASFTIALGAAEGSYFDYFLGNLVAFSVYMHDHLRMEICCI